MVSALVLGAVIAPLVVVWRSGGGLGRLGAADWAALEFTIFQAFLSASLSVVVAVPLARALARRRFVGRQAVITLMSAPFILPVIVAVLGIVAVFGQNGLLNSGLAMIGIAPISIYGLVGVLIAHVFFNLPLATRMILQGWQAVPNERLRLARQLGFGHWAMFRMIEWPVLRRAVPPAFAVIFVICLSSFAVVLTLGGGPRATTLELAIYQAFRFDFDLGKAATLATVQVLLAGGAALVCVGLGVSTSFGKGRDQAQDFGRTSHIQRLLDSGIIGLSLVFLALPIAMVVWGGGPHLVDLPISVWSAAGRSVVVALVSTMLCLCLALPLCSKWGEVVGTLGIALSPLVLGTGLFLILRTVVNPFDWALWVTVFLNALLSLPFVLRILRPAVETARREYARLGAALGLGAWAWLRWVLLPRIAPALGYAGGLAAALSMGDLGVIVLFADADRGTLPLKLYQLMGAYRMGDAAAAALVLVGLSLMAFWVFERLGRTYARD